MFHFGYPIIASLMITNLTCSVICFAVAGWYVSFTVHTTRPLQPAPNITHEPVLVRRFDEEVFKLGEISKISAACSACLFLSGCVLLKLGLDDLLLLFHRGVFRRLPDFFTTYRDRLELEYQYSMTISGCPWLVKEPDAIDPVKCQRTLMFKDPGKRRRPADEARTTEMEDEEEDEEDFKQSGIEESSGFEPSLQSEVTLASASDVNFLNRTN